MTTTDHTYQATFIEKLCHWLYSLLLHLITCIALFISLLQSPFKGSAWRQRKLQRFGFVPKVSQQGGLLLHCVSVGEVVAASSLVKRLRQKHPEYPVTITTTTPTGADRVKQIFDESVSHLYLPYDLPLAMQSLLKQVNPKLVMITEVELWPNLVHLCWRQQLPIFIINARLSDSSARNYQKLGKLFVPMLSKITGVCAQGQRDYNNYQKLGINQQKLHLCNNIKFDLEASEKDIENSAKLAEKLNLAERLILLGASTHDPEERSLISAYKQLKQLYPNLLLILVPRHPQRFDKVAKLLSEQAINFQKATKQPIIDERTEVLLVDQMGVLKSYYGVANIAFVGGSIAQRGGHNALEAALFDKPIIMGPHIYNNPEICQALQSAGALTIIQNDEQLQAQIGSWLDDKAAANMAGKAGKQVLADNAGAIEKTLSLIANRL